MNSHTPGPWKWRRVTADRGALIAMLLETEDRPRPHNDPCIMAAREDWVGFLDNAPTGEANARLIAAAPELLEALEGILWALDSNNLGQFTPSAIKAARAVIAKATGKE